jgi:hypothetical protein
MRGHRTYLTTKSSLISSRVLIREKLRFHREWLHGDCANAHRATRASHEARSGLRHSAGIAIAKNRLPGQPHPHGMEAAQTHRKRASRNIAGSE